MYEQFGAAVDGQEVEFRLFFPDRAVDPTQYTRCGLPHIARVRVTGTFQAHIGGTNWDYTNAPAMVPEPHPHGMVCRYKVPVGLNSSAVKLVSAAAIMASDDRVPAPPSDSGRRDRPRPRRPGRGEPPAAPPARGPHASDPQAPAPGRFGQTLLAADSPRPPRLASAPRARRA